MKTDPRTRYTKSIIEEAFLGLIREKPLSRVTVSEICSIAGINRGTFYRYYLDVYDLADQMTDEALEKVRGMIANVEKPDFISTFSGVLRLFQSERELFHTLITSSFGKTGGKDFMSRLFRICFTELRETIPGDSEEQIRLLAYITGGSGALIEYWLRSDRGETAEEIAALIGEYSELLLRRGTK